MPELPELNVYANALNAKLSGLSVISLRPSSSAKEQAALADANAGAVESVSRVGKQIQISTTHAQYAVHLMRTGEFFFSSEGEPKSVVGQIEFSDGTKLYVADRMRQARLLVGPVTLASPDAMQISLGELAAALATAGKQTLKAFLIDQSRVSGIGNAYADEILWAACVSPRSQCAAVPATVTESLHSSMQRVLAEATAQITEHLLCQWRGEYRDFLKVHRKGMSTDINGAKIINETVGGKSTYFVESQIEYL